jgi:hypothetical protein
MCSAYLVSSIELEPRQTVVMVLILGVAHSNIPPLSLLGMVMIIRLPSITAGLTYRSDCLMGLGIQKRYYFWSVLQKLLASDRVL